MILHRQTPTSAKTTIARIFIKYLATAIGATKKGGRQEGLVEATSC